MIDQLFVLALMWMHALAPGRDVPAPAFFGAFVVAMLAVAIVNEWAARDLQR